MKFNNSMLLVCLYPEKHGFGLGNKIVVADEDFYYISEKTIPISIENFQDMMTMGIDPEYHLRDAIKDFNFYKVNLKELDKSKIPVNFLRDMTINEIFQ